MAVGGYGDFYEEVVFGEGGGGFDLEEVGVGLVFSFIFFHFFFSFSFSFSFSLFVFSFSSRRLEGMSRRGKGRKEGSLVCLWGGTHFSNFIWFLIFYDLNGLHFRGDIHFGHFSFLVWLSSFSFPFSFFFVCFLFCFFLF